MTAKYKANQDVIYKGDDRRRLCEEDCRAIIELNQIVRGNGASVTSQIFDHAVRLRKIEEAVTGFHSEVRAIGKMVKIIVPLLVTIASIAANLIIKFLPF